MVKEIIGLLLKDVKAEWRNKQAISSIALYLFSIVLVLYYSLVRIDRMIWTGVLWLVLIFLAINSITASFSRDIKHRHWYYYSLSHPLSVYFSKALYNLLLLLLLNTLAVLMLGLFFGIPVVDWPLFLLSIFLCTVAISLIFTFVALISAKTGDQPVLMTILATPLIFPILMVGSRLCLMSLRIIQDSNYFSDILTIVAINMITFAMTVFLFPILWRD